MSFKIFNLWFKKHSQVLGLVFAILISVSIFYFREDLTKIGSYGYIGLFLLNVLGSATIFLPTPLFLASFAAAAFLNPVLVALVSASGSAIGEVSGYLAGRGAEDLLEKDAKLKKIKKWMDKYGLFTIFILAAIPNPLFDMAGIVAGAMEIPLKKFLLLVWAGKLIKFGAITFLGINSAQIVGTMI